MVPNKIFFSIILIILIVLGIISMSYKEQTALFPLVVICFGIILVILKIITLVRPEYTPILDPQGFFESSKTKHSVKAKDKDVGEKDQNPVLWKKEIYIFVWGVIFIFLIFIIGFLSASAISTFIFTKIIGRRNVYKSAIISLLMPLTLYFLFEKLLRIQLYTGILFQ
jgi:hypothetical protein